MFLLRIRISPQLINDHVSWGIEGKIPVIVFTKAAVLFSGGWLTYMPFHSIVLFYSHLLPGKTQHLVKDILSCAAVIGIRSPNGIQTVVGFFLDFVFQPWITYCLHLMTTGGYYSSKWVVREIALGETLCLAASILPEPESYPQLDEHLIRKLEA